MRATESSRLVWTDPVILMAIAVGVVSRMAAAVYMGDTVSILPGTADQLSYHQLALRVAGGHGFSFAVNWWPATPANEPTAHWSFLYTSGLASVYALAGEHPLIARLAQAMAVGVFQPLLVARIGCRLFGSTVGRVSAFIAALYAYLIYYAGALMTESLYIVAILWAIDLTLSLGGHDRAGAGGRMLKRWALLGIALTVAILLRQLFLLVVPVMLAWIIWRRWAGRAAAPWSARVASVPWAGVAVTTCVIAVCVLPWTVRNYRVFDQVVLLNTNAGFAFFWGNHPVHGYHFQPLLPGDGSAYGALVPADVLRLNEGAMDRALLRLGMEQIAADPVRYVWLCVTRIEEYFKFWPTDESGALANLARVLSFGLCLPWMIGGLLVAAATPEARRSAHPGVWLLVAIAFVYTAIHLLTWTLVRYRLPVDAVLAPFAALAMSRAFQLAGWHSARKASVCHG